MHSFNHQNKMYLDKTKKQEIFTQFGHDQKAEDTGSAESQIALFTYRIKHLTEHVKKHHKDFVTTRSLTQLSVSVALCSTIFTSATSSVTALSSRLLACVSNQSAFRALSIS